MRKISQEAAFCFKAHDYYKNGNTEVGRSPEDTTCPALFLYDTKIAWHKNDTLYLTFAGHPTSTTKARLNAVLFVYGLESEYCFITKKGKLYLSKPGAKYQEIEPTQIITFTEETTVDVEII